MANKDLKTVWSSRSDDWATPDVIYNYLERALNMPKDTLFDPCPLGAFEDGYNGLTDSKNWSTCDHVYINPPYSNIIDFVKTGIEYHTSNTDMKIVYLIPARTDTKYYKLLFEYGCKFMFIEGRLKFSNSKYSSTFPSVLVLITGGDNQIVYLSKDKLYGELK